MKNRMKISYRGVIVPMVTPFKEHGKIDRLSASRLIEYLIKKGTIPFILGTTGEAYSISLGERDVLVRILLEHQKEDVPLIAGMGGLTFEDTVRLANKYFGWGIDAVVLPLPGYFKLNDEQAYHYFYELSVNIKGDIILYNIPPTSHNSISLEVVDQLSQLTNIIGIKDSELDAGRMKRSLELWKGRDDFFYLVGVHELMPQGLRLGASGVVPSTANLAPGLFVKMLSMHLEGRYEEVEKIHDQANQILKLYINGYLLGESLAILKYLVSLNGMISPVMQTPLTGLSNKKKAELKLQWEKIRHILL
jgi:dihydrodipicolinate synthase/N-acetylneuraminate lyase